MPGEAETPQALFARRWPELRAAAEQGGARAVVAAIDAGNDVERRILHVMVRQGLVFEDWPGKSLDTVGGVGEAGVAELTRQADAAPDDASRLRLLGLVHAVAYNLAADLAWCWPGDDLPRTARHFVAGRSAARRCLELSEVLQLPPAKRAMSWWAKGMHELSLEQREEACASFATSLSLARAADDAFQVTLVEGYLGLAGEQGAAVAVDLDAADAAALLASALERFAADAVSPDGEVAENAAAGIAQLQVVRARYGSG